MKADQERLVTVLKDTISLLCKNSLSYDHQVVVQGLVCVTIDKQDVVVVQINDQLGDAALEPCAGCGQGRRTEPSTPRELKKRRRPSESDGEEDDDSESSSKVPCHQQHTTLTGRIERQDDKSKVKSEQERSDEDEDLIMIDSEIKGESYSRTSYSEDNDSTYNNTPGADNSYISGFMDSSNMAAIAGSQGAVSEPHWSAGGQPPAGTQHLDNSDLTPNSQAGPSIDQVCYICKLNIPSRSQMAQHLETHEGADTSKLFGCPWGDCDKAFKSRWDIQRHYSVHTQTKTFVCGMCGARFSRKYSLLRHTQKQHSDIEINVGATQPQISVGPSQPPPPPPPPPPHHHHHNPHVVK